MLLYLTSNQKSGLIDGVTREMLMPSKKLVGKFSLKSFVTKDMRNYATAKFFLIDAACIEESGEGESEKTYTRAERVMLYDSRLNVAGEIPLEGELCTALGAENGRLYLFIDKNMEIYEEKDGSWQNTGTRKLRHQVTQCHITDLDGDGVKEYILTDGMDLYVYHAVNDSFRKLWSTHVGVENFYGPLMSGDMNGDGVQEIYACDTTATTIRYILTEKGLKTANEDIQYGQCIYPCDFDGNGREDYWFVADNEDRRGQLYLAAEE